MMIKHCHGVIIHKRPYRNTSLMLDIFTREFGLLRAIMRGGKKCQTLGLFTPCWFELNLKNELATVYKVEVKSAALLLTGQLVLIGFYVNELLSYLLYPFDTLPDLYDEYLKLLKTLNRATSDRNIQANLRQFEIKLLTELGFGLCFSHEAINSKPILHDKKYRFIAEKGFIEDGNGIEGALLFAIENQRFDSPKVLKVAKNVLRQAIAAALGGKTLKSRALF
jgi:DNA repair protein RecO (recombination protein O)